jgi:Zn-finger nucleic acid-binding protein
MLSCPVCSAKLVIVERQGVELDTCFTCGGFWVDEGELDMLIQREAMAALALGHKAIAKKRQAKPYDSVDNDVVILTKPPVQISPVVSVTKEKKS